MSQQIGSAALPEQSSQALHGRERGSLDANGHEVPAASQYSVAASALHMAHKQQLGLSGLVCLIFLEVCGGPFGSEVFVPPSIDLPLL